MTKNIVKYVAVLWLSFLLLMGNTPMEFIHLFADHEDTVHTEYKGLVIEKKHHHCAYLSLTLDAFVNDFHFPVLTFYSVPYYSLYTVATPHYVQRSIMEASLRGPPVV